MRDFTATIHDTGERAAVWQEVMGGNELVLKSPIPSLAHLPGHEAALIYEMDLSALTAEQRERLIVALARKFRLSEQEVSANLDEMGCPILADDVTVTIHNPQRWF